MQVSSSYFSSQIFDPILRSLSPNILPSFPHLINMTVFFREMKRILGSKDISNSSAKSVLLSIRSILDGFLVDSWWIPARGRCTGKILGDARHLPVNQAQSSPNRVPKDHPLPQDS